MKREQARNLARQKLVQAEMRHLLLAEKELEQQTAALEHRLKELTPVPEPELLVLREFPTIKEALAQPRTPDQTLQAILDQADRYRERSTP